MQELTLTVKNIDSFYQIRKALINRHPLNEKQQNELGNLLGVRASKTDPLENIPLHEEFQIHILDLSAIEDSLCHWIKLFENIPGYEFCPLCLVVYDNIALLRENIIITASFSPTMAYNLERKEGFAVHLKYNGTACFWFPTNEDAKQYPELSKFNGSWKDAYLLLIETLKKGWPMEEFPEELQKFLPSKQ